MDYFLNEYSIRGQYENVEDFFEKLRNYTLPVLNKIEKQDGNIIWKKDTFWQSEICNGITLTKIPQKKNERTPELTFLQIKLIKLIIISGITYLLFDILILDKYESISQYFEWKWNEKIFFKYIFLNVSPFAGHLWFLSALLYCYILIFIFIFFYYIQYYILNYYLYLKFRLNN